MNIEYFSLLALHSFLEVFPISSSWHLKSLGASQAHIHFFHLWLLPIVFLYSVHQSRRSKIFELSYSTLVLSIIPTVICYVCLKSGFILSKIHLPAGALHIGLGGLLVLIYIRQKYFSLPNISISSTWILSGFLQSLALIFPASSRLGTSLLYALFYKIEFKTAFVISFALNLINLSAGVLLDFSKNALLLPSFIELMISSVFFCCGVMLAHRYDWNFIAACGIYRMSLGILMLLSIV